MNGEGAEGRRKTGPPAAPSGRTHPVGGRGKIGSDGDNLEGTRAIPIKFKYLHSIPRIQSMRFTTHLGLKMFAKMGQFLWSIETLLVVTFLVLILIKIVLFQFFLRKFGVEKILWV